MSIFSWKLLIGMFMKGKALKRSGFLLLLGLCMNAMKFKPIILFNILSDCNCTMMVSIFANSLVDCNCTMMVSIFANSLVDCNCTMMVSIFANSLVDCNCTMMVSIFANSLVDCNCTMMVSIFANSLVDFQIRCDNWNFKVFYNIGKGNTKIIGNLLFIRNYFVFFH